MSQISTLFLLAPALLLPATSNHAQPVAASALVPARVLDIATYTITPAPGAPKLLVHLWSAPRRNPAGGGTFGAPAGAYKGEITRAEVNGSRGLYQSPFVYDIFTLDGQGIWKYRASIFRADNSTPYAPTVRYLNSKTKRGFIFEIDQFGGQYLRQRTLYTFTDWDFACITRDISNVYPPARTGGVRWGFGRDKRGYAQLIEAQDGFNATTDKEFETRTVYQWDDQTRDWKAGRPAVIERIVGY